MSKALGFWRSWSLVVGMMIGSGVFMLPVVLAPYGSLSVLGWLFAGGGTLFIALMLGTLARRLPRIGGPYAYTSEALGSLAGFLVAWGYWIAVCSGVAAIAVAFVGYMGFFIPLVATSPLAGGVTALIVIWLITGINVAGTQSAGIFQLITTLLKLLPLFAIAGGGFLVGDISAVSPGNPDGASLPVLIAELVMLTMWAYVGVEGVTIPAEDIENPEKTIPRALVLGTLTATVVYLISTLGVMALIPSEQLATSTSPFADAALILFGPWGASLVAIGALISIVGSLNGNVLVAGMMPRAIALDRLFPARFASLNKAGVPAFALTVSGLFSSVLIVMNYTKGLVAAFEILILLSTLTTLLPYAASALAEIVLQQRDARAGIPKSWRTIGIALVALAFSLLTMVGAGLEVVAYGLILLAVGLPVYFGLKITS